jgi:hypothetical protein
MEAVVEVQQKAGRNRQLTERDRELCGFLAVCRYLTREQIERLMFPGRSKARSSTRLRQLAGKMGGQAAVVRGDLGYGSADGWTTVWALTREGFEIGSHRLGLKLDRVPKHDVGQAFLKHEVMANEIFLGLVPQDGKTWAKVPREFRWVLGEYLDLPFEEFTRVGSEIEARRLQPDAMLEHPASQRRFFLEYETGSATVRDAKKSTSTMAKLDRYGTFLCAPAGNILADKRETFYTRAFKDGWRPKVLFVSPSEARRQSIAAVIQERASSDKYKVPAKSLTLAEARLYLCRKLYGADRPPGGFQSKATPAMPQPRTPTRSTETAPTAREERLRRGRVSVRGEQLVNFERVLRTSLAALISAQKALEFHRVSREALPKAPADASEVLRIAGEYARRGQLALSRHNLAAAD